VSRNFCAGGVCASELLLTLNCGLGGILVIAPEDYEAVSQLLGDNAHHIVGTVTPHTTAGKYSV
jgi:phosphoribosylaminoimidazole (AIR) synthetase